MMEKDIFHEPYRKSLFPDFERIRTACRENGAYGMTISGAGPSLFVAVKQGEEAEVAKRLVTEFPYYECIAVQPSHYRCGRKISIKKVGHFDVDHLFLKR